MTDLYSAISDSAGKERANKLVLSAIHEAFHKPNKMTKLGHNTDELIMALFELKLLGELLFESSRGSSHEEREQILSQSFLYARNNGINLLEDPHFAVWIKDNSGRLNQDIDSSRYSNYWGRPPEDYIAMIEAGFISGDSDPVHICKRYYNIKRNYCNHFDSELIKSIASRKPEVLIKLVEDVDFVKNVSYSFRSIIYTGLISFGKLSKKAARKIRSDSSEEASDSGVRAIATNLHKFPNAAEILSQVMDTKHFSSAKYLAENVPKEYLPFMAVCQDQRVREIVVNRMHGVSNV
jgi:hypothetical protein